MTDLPDNVAVVSSADLMGPGSTWSARHHVALQHPEPDEAALAALLAGVRLAVRRFSAEAVARPALAHLLLGIEGLLNFDAGRIDRGSVSATLYRLAEMIDYDLGLERFVGAAEEENLFGTDAEAREYLRRLFGTDAAVREYLARDSR